MDAKGSSFNEETKFYCMYYKVFVICFTYLELSLIDQSDELSISMYYHS